MASASGRALRVVAGVGLIAGGYAMHSPLGTAIAVFGLLPLSSGAFDVCPISPLLGAPFRGQDVRDRPDGGT